MILWKLWKLILPILDDIMTEKDDIMEAMETNITYSR